MHTFEGNDVFFLHHGDFSGEIEIRSKKIKENTQFESEWKIKLDSEEFFRLVKEHPINNVFVLSSYTVRMDRDHFTFFTKEGEEVGNVSFEDARDVVAFGYIMYREIGKIESMSADELIKLL